MASGQVPGLLTSRFIISVPAATRYTGNTLMAGQNFEFVLSGGALEFRNTGADQPIICDGTSSLDAIPDLGGASLLSDGLTNGNMAVIAIFGALAAAGIFMLYSRWVVETASKAGPAATMVMPPPPPPSGEYGLPPMWSEHKDPNTGANYFYNSQTGATSWEKPVYKAV